MRLFAVIPACGQSKRLGQPKLLLPWRGTTLLEHVVAAFGPALSRIVVVTNGDLPELAERAAAAGATPLPLAAPTLDMRTTIQAGLDWLEQNERPQSEDGWFLLPGDSPGIQAEVVRLLAEAASLRREKSIFVPTHGGRRGHPALLRWRHVAAVRLLPVGQGIDAYLRSQSAATQELPMDDVGMLDDLDTAEDYRRLTREARP